MEQRTAEWFSARAGFVSASRMAGVMVAKRPSATRDNLIAELICERLTGMSGGTFSTPAIQRGIDLEPLARSWYEAQKEVMVEECGFIIHQTIPMFGASPDGLVGDSGLLEIKCPNTATHIETMLSQNYDTTYKYQIQTQLACTGRKWCDFVSYDDRMPEGMAGVCFRVHRDDDLIAAIEAAVIEFNAELAEKLAKLQSIYF